MITDWQRRTWHVDERGAWGRPTVLRQPAGGVYGPLSRPPLGPPLAGKRATCGGRGNRRCQTDEAKAARVALAWRAYNLRVGGGLSIRDIAETLGVGKTTVGKWLYGCPALPNLGRDSL
jgi:hypothetical protein